MKSPTNGHGPSPKKRKKVAPSKARLLLSISPQKAVSTPVVAPSRFDTSLSQSITTASISSTPMNESVPVTVKNCDVCQTEGTAQNLVK